MSAALEEMRREGRVGIVREAEQADIEFEEMERARSAFKPVPSMAQQTELRGFMEGAMARAEARGLPFTLPPGVERELVGFEGL